MTDDKSQRHPCDSHGGFSKGKSAQELFQNSMMARGDVVEVTQMGKDQDLKGCDFLVKTADGSEKTVGVESIHDPIADGYTRLRVGSLGNDKIASIFNSTAEMTVFYYAREDRMVIYKTSTLVDAYREEVESSRSNAKYATSFYLKPEYDIDKDEPRKRAIKDRLLYVRERRNGENSLGFSDIQLFVPTEELEKLPHMDIKVPAGAYQGLFK